MTYQIRGPNTDKISDEFGKMETNNHFKVGRRDRMDMGM